MTGMHDNEEVAAPDYGFKVRDRVCHVGDNNISGIVTELDAEHDLGGVTTCRVVWDAKTFKEAMESPREDHDIQWTNKLFRLEEAPPK